MKIAFETLGCKLNQAETESLIADFAGAGWEITDDVAAADVYVINTCTVTAESDAKARHRIANAHRQNPGAFIAVTGCYAQRAGEKIGSLPGVALVVPNDDKNDLRKVLTRTLAAKPTERPVASTHGRTRSFVKIQDGCDGACAYCIVPTVRGQPTSVPTDLVIQTVRDRADAGFKEIVVTGTEIGSYNDGTADLEALLRRILLETSVQRLRVSSLQPNEITPSLLELWNDKRLCPHLHISLQSGSDGVLQGMRRRYSVEGYSRALACVRQAIPDVAITTDVIAGFPGETDDDFEATLRVCGDLRFARIHVFPFSSRPGTEAASLPDKVNPTVKNERARRLLALADESATRFREGLSGATRPVLWERKDSRGYWAGLTDNYVGVRIRSDEDLRNRITTFRL